MYIFIDEDGSITKDTKLGEDSIDGWNDGVLDIIFVNDMNPKLYNNGEWMDITDS